MEVVQNDRSEEAIELTSDEKLMSLLCHLMSLTSLFIIPLVLWLVKRNESAYVNYHGKESLNFNITFFIILILAMIPYMYGAAVESIVILLTGVIIILVFSVVFMIYTIIAGIKAYEGKYYRYPFTLRLIS